MMVRGSVVIDDVTSREACPDLLYAPRPSTPPPCQNSATKWDAQEREGKILSQAQPGLKRKIKAAL